MPVLLFDIDGTLINTGGAGGAALRSAFSTIFGIEQPQDVPFSGRTDRAIGRDMFEIHAVDNTTDNWTRLCQEYIAQLGTFLPRCRGRALPGVPQLLQNLSTASDIAVGLLTGNVREGARLKLDHYGLYQHFAFGGFGDEHLDRNDVAESALAAARRHGNGTFQEGSVWVIGDTPLDIRCARWIGARVLAVTTGVHMRDELARCEPDVLLDDLSDLRQLLSILR